LERFLGRYLKAVSAFDTTPFFVEKDFGSVIPVQARSRLSPYVFLFGFECTGIGASNPEVL
jgi:hypothetical protein